ncbi:Holliday junction resolvase-like protein [Hymenobacter guriensis]|uniref:Holliday junction resolvase-related domain-containing protein n=1 Tax=Hymenobacter guriensis TaxID=2793065 RepID=A0ABS0L4D4_9BACT|nr:Holliday junction resolvase-like protein [Hymenobacter guriensis]MBG8554952.1 hypothetical protein [Hymenobacter guriensis]
MFEWPAALLLLGLIVVCVFYYQTVKALLASKLKVEHLSTYSQSLNNTISTNQEQNQALKMTIEALQLKLEETYSNMPALIREQVYEQVEQYKKSEVEYLRATLAASAKQAAMADLENWKAQNEMFFRQDAINRSQAVIMGKVTEHLIPFQNGFPFNPKEARFIGSPIDMIVFDGIDNEDVVDVYMLEIKTGDSSLSKRQRLIRDAVMNGRVHWRELRL